MSAEATCRTQDVVQFDVEPALVTGYDAGRRDIVAAVRLNIYGKGEPALDTTANYVTPSRGRLVRNRVKHAFQAQGKRRHTHGGKANSGVMPKGKSHIPFRCLNGAICREICGRSCSGSWLDKDCFNIMTGRPRIFGIRWCKHQSWTTSLGAVPCARPSAKVTSMEAMQEHISSMLRTLGRTTNHNIDRKQVRRCHFQSYTQREAALDTLCHRWAGGGQGSCGRDVCGFGISAPSRSCNVDCAGIPDWSYLMNISHPNVSIAHFASQQLVNRITETTT